MKWTMRIYVILLIALMTTGGVLILVLPQQSFSENENRVLTELSAPTVETYFSGDFQKSFETAISDQFPLRDTWTGFSTGIRRLLGLHDAGGVYLGNDSYYIEKKLNKDVPVSQYNKNIGILKRFIQQNPKTKVMLVPSPATILPDKLPTGAAIYDADAMFGTASRTLGDAFIDVREALQDASKDKQTYYRTDHHWTAAGAYAAYREYDKNVGLTGSSVEPQAFSYSTVTEDFLGTTYSKALSWGTVPDSIQVPDVFIPDTVKVTLNDNTPGSVFVPEKLATKDKYAYFFGGNYASVTIENPACTSDRELVIFKDSFANCFVPMLIGSYKEITMVDLRYETRPVRMVMGSHPDADCLVLYEMSTFATSSEVARMGL